MMNRSIWYDNSENLGILGLGTIPIEDIGYAFTMLFWKHRFNRKIQENEFVFSNRKSDVIRNIANSTTGYIGNDLIPLVCEMNSLSWSVVFE